MVSTGKCIILCVTRNLKNCEGLLTCAWKCFAPNSDGPPPNRDNDIPPPAISDDSENITPSDLVRLAICMVRCLTRYLPRNKSTLQQWGTCFAIRCVCADQ